ncbi:uncharacterized protein [Lolium perenne]|uniref:uncharacterized protein n=1 Tax=Lolium perenne TaxID=4522 RepID=UPI0021F5D84F|nr:putative disease resistance protein At3g14460 [Lolium perenne]
MDCRSSSITPRDLECMLCDKTIEPKALPLSLLEEITDGFSDEQRIGSGGFAVVYKGKLENRMVAVKRMSNTYMHEKEFHREVECLMMVKHKNIVQFLGYCADTQGTMARHEGKFVMADVQQRLLCFEYLSKGSLDEYITDTSSGLQWRDRYHIIKGICQGLHYLHQKNIIHLDLKPANILLDDNLVAKIADFGLSRYFDERQTRVLTDKIAGTLGYLAPEFCNKEITYKFDIYSLGVIIIEILTGKKGYHDIDKVVESWSNMLEKSHSKVQHEQVRVCAEIGIECTNFNPAKRPDTEHIISRLDEAENFDKYVETGKITSHEINPDTLSGTMHVLWLIYQRLNPDIRPCIQYCSIFPRGSKLKTIELVSLWIAQGFVKASVTEDMEDVAERYIRELVSCSFLQPQKTWDGSYYFTIHDVLHDLLTKVARNCFRIENAKSHIVKGWEGDVPLDVNHLFVQNYDGELITEKILGLKNLLTLIVNVVEEDTRVEEEVIESIFKELPELRVLAIAFSKEHRGIEKLYEFSIPESICQLKHLRYFAFRTSASCMLILPRELNTLHHIQLLDFGDGEVLEFSFPDLINLRHIFCWCVKFTNIDSLILLRTIPAFKINEGCDIEQLRDLNKLRGSLEILGLPIVKREEALGANLSAKEWLTELVLSWDYYFHVHTSWSSEAEAQVLEGLRPPVGLQRLDICDYSGSRYPDWMAGNKDGGPKDLKTLSFVTSSQPGPDLAAAFPRLRELSFVKCMWDALPGNMEHLTSLEKLDIDSCKNIRFLPTLPKSLGMFTLIRCNDELEESCKTVGHPNWQKIEHIPTKYIGDPLRRR